MSFFPLKKLPRYECLLRAAEEHPELDPSACEAFLNLLRAGDEAFQTSAVHFMKRGLSPGGFMVLMLLNNRHQCEEGAIRTTPAALADWAGVTRATMTGLIDTLERDRLVRRRPAPTDRRMMLVDLTPRGREVLRQIVPGHFRRMAEFMAPLGEGERKTLVHLLQKLCEQLGRVGARAPSSAHAA
jgi:DNA-binding MarR family transcriptional regulator